MIHPLLSPSEQTPNTAALATAKNEYGSMRLQLLDGRLGMYATSQNAAEITDVQLEATPQALMAGQLLLSSIEKQAREQGIQELLVTSGPTASKTAVEFWNRVLGKPVATAEDYYGTNYAASIWRTLIAND